MGHPPLGHHLSNVKQRCVNVPSATPRGLPAGLLIMPPLPSPPPHFSRRWCVIRVHVAPKSETVPVLLNYTEASSLLDVDNRAGEACLAVEQHEIASETLSQQRPRCIALWVTGLFDKQLPSKNH